MRRTQNIGDLRLEVQAADRSAANGRTRQRRLHTSAIESHRRRPSRRREESLDSSYRYARLRPRLSCALQHTSASLLTDLTASLADKTLPLRLRRYQRPELLVIDEFAFDRVERLESPQAAHLLYKVIVARHHRRSTALVTNIDFDGWADYLGDGPLAMALLDRLVEGAIIVKIKGRSYRARKAKTGKSSSEDQSSS